MNYVYALTPNFIERSIPSMRSVLEHDPKARIYLLTETDQADLPFPVTVINVSDQQFFPVSGVNYGTPYSYINLLKCVYPEILKKINKVIHLDADTIVCDSLEPIWKTDLKGKWFAAVREDRGHYHPFGPAYYNAGVMVINLQQMRTDGIVPKMVEYLNTVRQPYADQDAWNKYAIEQDKAVALPVRYNENFATGETKDPAIVHFCGIKTWWTDARMHRREYLERYM